MIVAMGDEPLAQVMEGGRDGTLFGKPRIEWSTMDTGTTGGKKVMIAGDSPRRSRSPTASAGSSKSSPTCSPRRTTGRRASGGLSTTGARARSLRTRAPCASCKSRRRRTASMGARRHEQGGRLQCGGEEEAPASGGIGRLRGSGPLPAVGAAVDRRRGGAAVAGSSVSRPRSALPVPARPPASSIPALAVGEAGDASPCRARGCRGQAPASAPRAPTPLRCGRSRALMARGAPPKMGGRRSRTPGRS